MEVKRLTPADMKQVRAVWKECFSDSDAFLDTYFESVVDITNGIGFFQNGKLVSNLFAAPMSVNISGMVYASEFISGCATMPESRNQHLMHDLIYTALTDMRSRHVCVAYLHPFEHSFYRKFGFETVNYVQSKTADEADPAGSSVRVAASMSEIPADALYASYEAYISQYGSFFMRSQSRMMGWLKLLFDDGGHAVYVDGAADTPYALFYGGTDDNGNPVNDIFELVYFSAEQRSLLTEGTGAAARYMVPCSATDRSAEEYTMMRVVCPDIMLESYRYNPGTQPFVINIHDSFLESDYNLKVTPQAAGGATVENVQAESDIVADIADMAQLLTGTFDPLQFPDAARVFQQNSSCYFDTY